jgi:choline kinase
MQAVILAAGFGSRLGRHKGDDPKTLIKIGDRTLIDHILKTLKKNGVRNVIIITGYKREKIQEYLKGKYTMDIKFVHNSDYETTNNIYSLYLAKEELSGGNFYIINSDVLFHERIFQNLHFSNKEGLILSVDLKKKLKEEDMKVIRMGDRITRISKEISLSEASGEYIGLSKVTEEAFKKLFRSIKEVISHKGTGVFYEEAFQHMIDSGYWVTCESTRGLPWIEIDTVEDLKLAREKIFPRIVRTRYQG